MRPLFSALGIIFSCTLLGQTCFDPIACNFNETGDCIYNDSPAVQMASVEYWTLVFDWDCDGTSLERMLYFNSDNTFISINIDNTNNQNEGYFSFCNNTYTHNYLITTPTSNHLSR